MKNGVKLLLFLLLFLLNQPQILMSMNNRLAVKSSRRLKRRSLARRQKRTKQRSIQDELSELIGDAAVSLHKEEFAGLEASLVVAIEKKDISEIKRILKLMKERDKSINCILSYTEGLTALHLAIDVGNEDVLSLILSVFGVDINHSDRRGFTPLHRAVLNKKRRMAEMLLSMKQIDINCGDHNGETPLHFAVRNNDREFIELLLLYGANPNLKNNLGESANSLVMEFGTSSNQFLEDIYPYYLSPLAKDLIELIFCSNMRFSKYIAKILLARVGRKNVLRNIRKYINDEAINELFFFLCSGCVHSPFKGRIQNICKKVGLNFKALASYSKFKEDMGMLFDQRGETGDFIIYLGGESEIKIHKAILYARSKFFRRRFDGCYFNGSDFCSFEQYPCSTEIWNLMLEFLYTGGISIGLEDSEIQKLIDLGGVLQVRVEEELLPALERRRIK